MKTKKPAQLFDKIVQVSERTDPDFPNIAEKQIIKAYKATKGKKAKEEFTKASPEYRRVLRKHNCI